MRKKSENLLTIAVIGGWLALWCAIFWGFHALSFNGYFPHFVETEISVQPDWIIGETKNCKSYPHIPQSATYFKKGLGYAADSLYCDDKLSMHLVKVNLYGRLYQPEHNIAYWSCTRNSESFTCRQTGVE
jgi:hypothetical protein